MTVSSAVRPAAVSQRCPTVSVASALRDDTWQTFWHETSGSVQGQHWPNSASQAHRRRGPVLLLTPTRHVVFRIHWYCGTITLLASLHLSGESYMALQMADIMCIKIERRLFQAKSKHQVWNHPTVNPSWKFVITVCFKIFLLVTLWIWILLKNRVHSLITVEARRPWIHWEINERRNCCRWR